MSENGDKFPPEVEARIHRERAARSAVQAKDPAFFAAVSAAMFERDLMGNNDIDNTDEYDAEAGTVIPRLAACRLDEDLARVLLEEFQRWFGVEIAGSDLSPYRALAADIWFLHGRRADLSSLSPE